MNNFDLTALAVSMVCPNNIVKFDTDKGYPGVYVRIPKMTMAQLIDGGSNSVHPAFIVNGTEVDEVLIGKYQAHNYGGKLYSLPGVDPAASADFDAFTTRGFATGEGFHEITAAEWGLIALICKKNGTLPYGNNNYGKDSRENGYKAIPSMARDSNGRIQRVATGTGPLTWSHDRTLEGIWDLNGNVWEWIGGLRFVKGELQILENNNAADPANSQAAGSSQWKAIDGTTGQLIAPDGNGTTANSLKLDFVSNKWQWITGAISSSVDDYRSCSFSDITCAATVCAAAKELLYAYALAPDSTTFDYEGDIFYLNNGADERLACRGGYWYYGADNGVFSFIGNYARSLAYVRIGGRSAFVDLP